MNRAAPRLLSRAPISTSLCATLLFASVAAQARAPRPADLVVRGGKVSTVDAKLGEVSAIAVRGDRIVAVGSDEEIGRYIGQRTKVVALEGRRVVPGFIEGHAHFTGIGQAKMSLDLMHVRNWDEVVALVKDAVAKARPGQWIVGRGWHQEKWDGKPTGAVEGFPTHHSISAVSPNNPVALRHASGHAAFYNAKAMQLAGVTKKTRAPKGGEILKDEQGEPIGVFRETAAGLVSRVYSASQLRRKPADRRADLERMIQLANDECMRLGVTSFQDAGSGFGTIDALREVVEKGKLDVRLYVMIRSSNSQLARRLATAKLVGFGQNHLTVRALKRSIDGALGPRGAWLLEPYSDLPTSRGLETASVASVTETARLGVEHGFQVCIHAIGDRANREVLDIFEKFFAKHPELKDPRWRIEHAQHLHPTDIPRFGKLGVIASMQGVHCTSDGPWIEPRLGAKRAEEGAYVWKKLRESGAIVTNGTDAPVEDLDPIASFYASVSRMMKNGKRFYPSQRMTREQALRSYTLDAAYAAFEDDLKGSLTPGKLADFVVLSKDIMTCDEAEIPKATVDMTFVGGRLRYRK